MKTGGLASPGVEHEQGALPPMGVDAHAACTPGVGPGRMMEAARCPALCAALPADARSDLDRHDDGDKRVDIASGFAALADRSSQRATTRTRNAMDDDGTRENGENDTIFVRASDFSRREHRKQRCKRVYKEYKDSAHKAQVQRCLTKSRFYGRGGFAHRKGA